MQLIDTHSHLFDSQFDEDLPLVLERAAQASVVGVILPAIDSSSHEAMLRLAESYPNSCFPTMGLHPTSVNDNPCWLEELDLVRAYLCDPRYHFYAVGEIGLDLYWSRDFMQQQIQALIFQIELAIEHNLPLILHVREAWDEILDLLTPYAGRVRGVFHSFSGSVEHWNKIDKLFPEFMVGLSGPLTYKKSQLPDIVKLIPLERIVLETDSPYLPPVPYRGKRNESSYVTLVAEQVARIKEVDIEQVAAVTSDNARRLFALDNVGLT